MLKYIVMVTVRVPKEINLLQEECRNNNVSFFYGLPEEELLINETLYITDHHEVYKGLKEEGANVLAWLYEENEIWKCFSSVEFTDGVCF